VHRSPIVEGVSPSYFNEFAGKRPNSSWFAILCRPLSTWCQTWSPSWTAPCTSPDTPVVVAIVFLVVHSGTVDGPFFMCFIRHNVRGLR